MELVLEIRFRELPFMMERNLPGYMGISMNFQYYFSIMLEGKSVLSFTIFSIE